MRKYEMLYILSTDLAEEVRDNIVAKFENVVKENGGSVEKVDKWGVKKLAYPINYKTEGYYVLVNFKSAPTLPLELERVFGITDGILRNIVIKHDEKKLAKKAAAPAVTEAPAEDVLKADKANVLF